jgi:hypothetical protein
MLKRTPGSALFLRMFADAGALTGDARRTAQDMIVDHGFWAMEKKRF